MEFFIPIAAKSFLIAGVALLLLKLAGKRSAAERSWIAHLGLAAILILPLAAIALPSLEVRGPAFLPAPAAEVVTAQPAAASAVAEGIKIETEAAAAAANFPAASPVAQAASAVDWGFWLYAAPAALLLLLTLIALGRLFALRARANVLVEPHWLAALAHAQRRMGFKHGTALLTSDDLPSPISWGVMRPVILLNSEAADSHAEAEAIIAHELAHVASLDWAKLLLSRVTVALFWFNPLVWLLAREAHQLREEAADDAVLGADIEDTDYAKLLVGVARHECRGLLIGAHGVAPGRNSLSRRVRRVLDSGSVRGPVGRAFALGMFAGAAMLAAPLAALTLTPRTAQPDGLAATDEPTSPYYVGSAAPRAAVIEAKEAEVAKAVRTALAGARAANPELAWTDQFARHIERQVVRANAVALAQGRPPTAAEINATVAAAVANAGRGVPSAAAINASVSAAVAHAVGGTRIERAVELKAVGATPEYVAAIRSAAPHLRLDHDDIVQLKAVGVSPAYVRGLASSGYPRLGADDIVEAHAMGIDGDYLRGIAGAGYGHLPMDQLVELKAVGVTPSDVSRFRRANHGLPSVDDMVEAKVLGLQPSDLDPDPDPDP